MTIIGVDDGMTFEKILRWEKITSVLLEGQAYFRFRAGGFRPREEERSTALLRLHRCFSRWTRCSFGELHKIRKIATVAQAVKSVHVLQLNQNEVTVKLVPTFLFSRQNEGIVE